MARCLLDQVIDTDAILRMLSSEIDVMAEE